MKIYIANKETGMFIEQVGTIAGAKALIEQYERIDKANDDYEPDFYDVVDENHNSLIYG